VSDAYEMRISKCRNAPAAGCGDSTYRTPKGVVKRAMCQSHEQPFTESARSSDPQTRHEMRTYLGLYNGGSYLNPKSSPQSTSRTRRIDEVPPIDAGSNFARENTGAACYFYNPNITLTQRLEAWMQSFCNSRSPNTLAQRRRSAR